MQILYFIKKFLRPRGKIDFLTLLPKNSFLLDVGCGSNSSRLVKEVLPFCTYTGVDIIDYHQTKPSMADFYVVTTPDNFSNFISTFKNKFDAVISSHNLEHCNDRVEVIENMLNSLKVGGFIYLSFPSDSSINFFSRRGTLNYFDDPTHQGLPPDFNSILSKLEQFNFELIFISKNYKPYLLSIFGFFMEPLSILFSRNMIGTWEYYGFESIIIARKRF